MATFLVTGANRGIGLELTKQLAELDDKQVSKVFAVSRGQTSEGLSKLISTHHGKVVHISCEVTKEDSIQPAVREVESKLDAKGLDVLVNNVGVQPWTPDGIIGMKGEKLLDTFNANVVSTHLVTSAFLGLLRAGTQKKIINMYDILSTIEYQRKLTNLRAAPPPWVPSPTLQNTIMRRPPNTRLQKVR